ncbi:MAG: hypothetical protein JSS14_22135 [Proteobacteria bacterium]|nr:hypothetical protein [Pseudomonadota bacterium]
MAQHFRTVSLYPTPAELFELAAELKLANPDWTDARCKQRAVVVWHLRLTSNV